MRYPNENRPATDIAVHHWKHGPRNLATVSGAAGSVNGTYVYNDINGSIAWERKYNDNKPDNDDLTTPFNNLDKNVSAWDAATAYSIGDIVGPETVGNNTQKYYKLIATAPQNTAVANAAKWAEIKTRYAIFKVDQAHAYYDAMQIHFVGKYIIWRFADAENGVDKKVMQYQNLLTQANINVTQGAFDSTTNYALNNIVGPEADGNYHKMTVNENNAATPLSDPAWLLLGKEALPADVDTGDAADATDGVVTLEWEDLHVSSSANVPKNGAGWTRENLSVDALSFHLAEFAIDQNGLRTNFNFPNQNTPPIDATVGDRGYYGNDNMGYYPNSNRNPDLGAAEASYQPPNSNIDLENT